MPTHATDTNAPRTVGAQRHSREQEFRRKAHARLTRPAPTFVENLVALAKANGYGAAELSGRLGWSREAARRVEALVRRSSR